MKAQYLVHSANTHIFVTENFYFYFTASANSLQTENTILLFNRRAGLKKTHQNKETARQNLLTGNFHYSTSLRTVTQYKWKLFTTGQNKTAGKVRVWNLCLNFSKAIASLISWLELLLAEFLQRKLPSAEFPAKTTAS